MRYYLEWKQQVEIILNSDFVCMEILMRLQQATQQSITKLENNNILLLCAMDERCTEMGMKI